MEMKDHLREELTNEYLNKEILPTKHEKEKIDFKLREAARANKDFDASEAFDY